MKQVILKILSIVFQYIDELLCKLHLKRPVVMVYMDGGICSQMLIYIHGQYYAEHGLDVYYDDYWWGVNGKDQYGSMARTFELTEMWPNLEFKTPSKWQRKWYLLFFKAKRINGDMLPIPESVKHSIYLNEYWDLPAKAYDRLFATTFILRNSTVPAEWSHNKYDNVVGVHVRRGDLAKGDNPYYGGVTDGYFVRAIDFCNQQFAPQKYIFFSDEPDWVEKNICNQLKQPYEIMRENKAWEDLWLLAQCPIIVASQGSFGKFAARLNSKAVLIQCDNKYAWRDRENTYFIQ